MKKMIAMGAIAACASVFALESANIVGYASSTLKTGGTMLTPQFLNIGENTDIPLQSIVAVGDDASDNVQIQTLDAYGRTVGA